MTRKSVTWMCAALMVTGLGLLSTQEASAGWGQGVGYRTNGYQNQNYGNRDYGNQRYGNSSYGYQNSGYQQNRGYAQPRYNNYNSQGSYGRGQYHDTTHYDYHPPTVTRHGNHLDYTPGHYDLHRSGHYDRH